jgi:hypothetical protein
MPNWIQYLQALATPAVALLAIVIALLQWRTAHQRAVLDLFDRRMQAFDSLNAAVAEIMREGARLPIRLFRLTALEPRPHSFLVRR